MDEVASRDSTDARDTRFGPANYIKITIFGFALSALWNSLHSIILPLRVLDFAAESQKSTYLSLLIGTGLIVAMAIQPIAGAISDRSGFGWGRRRPYILLGTILAVLFLPGIGPGSTFIALFSIYCLLQVSSNIAQGPYQGFIPDLVPEGKRGLASGVKTLFEMAGGLAVIRLIAQLMDRYFTEQGDPWLWYTLAILGILLLGTMLATVLTVKERPGTGGSGLPLLAPLYKSFKIDIGANRDFVWFLVSRFLVLTAFAILQKFALFFLMDVIGVANPAAITANLLIVIGICILATVYPAGRLSDRIGRRPIAVFSGLLGALAIVVLFFSPGYGYIMFSGGLLGIASGAFLSVNWAMATDLVAKGEEARYLGLTNLATAGSSALTLFIIGPLIDFFNARAAGLGYSVMFLACFIYFVVGSVLLLKIRKPG